ncbi:Oidioi.mRNA.OKI2018_I69.chr1.g524.t1.cds [Oikopleura dioica]|uniref:Oidioi.mRNA.OKI2018_I69.chr1.g524.t1.cds n=1 Tax=Oikopleura dioica TaxID=34765 RepID=A0ABN7SPI1_OIKDI|nr:Oidioi.mRNA.OKI2018_I69.chr1.g524.t1.cds [Oikopleura dioica]
MKLLGSLLVAGALGASVKRSASPKSGRRSGSPRSASPRSADSPKMDSPLASPDMSPEMSPEWELGIPEEFMGDKEKMKKMVKKFMMIKNLMKEAKLGQNGVFAPVKNDIETDVDLEQNFITNINIDFDDDKPRRRPESPHHKGPKSPEDQHESRSPVKDDEHESRSPDHEVSKMDLEHFFELLEEYDGDFPALLVNIQNFVNQNNVIDTDVNMEILNGDHDFERPEKPEEQPEAGWEVWDGTTGDEARAAFDGERAFIKFVNFMEEHGEKLPQILVNVQNFINQNNVMDTDVNMEILNSDRDGEKQEPEPEAEFGWPVWDGDKTDFEGHSWRDMEFELEDVLMFLKEKLDLEEGDFKRLMKNEKAKKMFKEICEEVKKMMKK